MITTFVLTTSISFLMLLGTKADFNQWNYLFASYSISSAVTLLVTLALVYRIVALQHQVTEAFDQALSSARSRFITDNFASLRLHQLGQACSEIQETKRWLENRLAAQDMAIKHLHTQLRVAASFVSRLEDALALSRKHTTRAAGEATALKALNITLQERLDQFERKCNYLKGENVVVFKILDVASYPELIARDIERTAQCSSFRDKYLRAKMARKMAHASLCIVMDEKTTLSDKFVSLKDASKVMTTTIFELQQKRQTLEITLAELRTERDGLEASVQELGTEQTNLQLALMYLMKERGILANQKDKQQNTIVDLTTENDRLKTNIDRLAKDQVCLRSSLNNLQITNSGLAAEKEALATTISSLRKEWEESQATIEELSEDRIRLQTAVTELSEERQHISIAHENLKRDHHALQRTVIPFPRSVTI
ncbi:hypothetical protein OF83DRAFT_321037 [Amylostereum chailletii]|nr:hypothetical protein OF83DRAFT_321037 [Amylostereum chailletii]